MSGLANAVDASLVTRANRVSFVACVVVLAGSLTACGARTEPSACPATLDSRSAAARPVTPWANSIVGTSRPMFRWTLVPAFDGARVELCEDVACSRRVHAFDAPGRSVRSPVGLSAGVWFWRVSPMVGGEVACGASAVWGFRVRPRTDAPREPMGTYIDMQPDGLADVIVPTRVGAHGADIRVVWGAAVGWPAGDWHRRLEVAPDPRRPDQHARWPRGTVDADGDGGSDVVVLWLGEPSAVFVSTTVTASRTLLARGTSPSLVPNSGPGVPTATVPLGDRNGDGYQDVLVETFPLTHENFGPPLTVDGAPLLTGGPNGPTWTFSNDSTPWHARGGRCPLSVGGRFEASPADWDGDGFADLAVAPNLVGCTAGGMLRGPTLTLNRDQLAIEATFSGPSSDPRSEGTSVRLVPDVDGDGWPDALVWASWPSGARRTTRVVSGAPDAGRAVQEFEQRADAYPMYAVGDVDGDDVGDIVVAGGQPLIVDVRRGGAAIARHPTWSLSYPECSDARVQALDVPGDVDGDGRDEIVVGVHSRECGSRVLVLSWSSASHELGVRATWNAPDRSVLDFGAGAL